MTAESLLQHHKTTSHIEGVMKEIESIRIQTFPRIHFSLIGLNSDGYRKFGGIGLALASPEMTLSVKKSDTFQMAYNWGNKQLEYSNIKLLNILQSIFEIEKFKTKISIEITSTQYPHSGFGTGTSMTLASLESLFIFNNRKISKQKLIFLSGRGRTSGVGIQTYFHGGFIFDIGVKNFDNEFLPSNLNKNNVFSTPLLISKLPNWELLVCIPKNIKPLTTDFERLFFKKNTPLSDLDVNEILYHSVFGVASSIIEEDFEAFCQSLKNLQNTKWKKLERSNFSNDLYQIEDKIYSLGAQAIGMSSLGPIFIVFSNHINSLQEKLNESMNEELIVERARFINSGRIINVS